MLANSQRLYAGRTDYVPSFGLRSRVPIVQTGSASSVLAGIRTGTRTR